MKKRKNKYIYDQYQGLSPAEYAEAMQALEEDYKNRVENEDDFDDSFDRNELEELKAEIEYLEKQKKTIRR